MNLYQVLGVDNNATHKEIKQAYHKCAIKHHPDKGGDAVTFKEVNEAYETLSSTEKRQLYDAIGSTTAIGFNPIGFNPIGFNPIDYGFNPTMDLFKMFERDFFGPYNNHPFTGFRSANLSQGVFFSVGAEPTQPTQRPQIKIYD